MVSIGHYKVSPFTLIFIKDGAKVLFLKRSPAKQIFPGKISGIGGKIEPGESWEDSAIREVAEESGLTISKVTLKGNFIGIVPEKNYINVINIALVTEFSGNLKSDPDEGTLFWEKPEIIVTNPDLVGHLKHYLLQVTSETSDFYSGIGTVINWELVDYADNKLHFETRLKK